jgi:hypothetical protein
MSMRVCYLYCHEPGLFWYLVIHIENLLRPLQLFYFHLWHIYWLSLVNDKEFRECLNFSWRTLLHAFMVRRLYMR